MKNVLIPLKNEISYDLQNKTASQVSQRGKEKLWWKCHGLSPGGEKTGYH